jgi:thiamine pyrophosphate-dependent acetolactate synthase large subunit-like protein
VILSLETQDLWSLMHSQTGLNRFGMESHPTTLPDAKLIHISAVELNHKSNYQDFGRLLESTLSITGDAEATLPALIEEVKRQLTTDRERALADRGTKTAEAIRKARERDRELAAIGWDASPITTARLSAELWAQIKNEDWSLVSFDLFQSAWPGRLWDFKKHYQYIGGAGGAGIGYGAPAAVGAALANRKRGRLTVNIQCDGDMNYAPGVLWTAAHHRIPLLTVMHNNRAYHQERMYLQLVGNKLDRGVTKADVGTALTDPDIDYASIAKGYSHPARGRLARPEIGRARRTFLWLGPALSRRQILRLFLPAGSRHTLPR